MLQRFYKELVMPEHSNWRLINGIDYAYCTYTPMCLDDARPLQEVADAIGDDFMVHTIDMAYIEYDNVPYKAVYDAVMDVCKELGLSVDDLPEGVLKCVPVRVASMHTYNVGEYINFYGISFEWLHRVFLSERVTGNERAEYKYNSFRVRFNPNKWTALAYAVLCKVKPTHGVLKKWDYARDIPYLIPSQVMIKTREKETSLKDCQTRYFGKHGTNGYTKVYDKGAEFKKDKSCDIQLDYKMCRVEETYSSMIPTSNRREYTIPNIFKTDKVKELSQLTDTERAFVANARRLMELGLSPDLSVGRKTKEKLAPFFRDGCNLPLCTSFLEGFMKDFNCVVLGDVGLQEEEEYRKVGV